MPGFQTQTQTLTFSERDDTSELQGIQIKGAYTASIVIRVGDWLTFGVLQQTLCRLRLLQQFT